MRGRGEGDERFLHSVNQDACFALLGVEISCFVCFSFENRAKLCYYLLSKYFALIFSQTRCHFVSAILKTGGIICELEHKFDIIWQNWERC